MNKKSFTILEILVVLSVISILVGIAVIKLKAMQDETRIYKARNELKVISVALESYYNHHNAYPANSTTMQSDSLISEEPNIIGTPLIDPFGDTGTSEYQYRLSSNGKYYVIWSDGFPGQIKPTGISDSGNIIF